MRLFQRMVWGSLAIFCLSVLVISCTKKKEEPLTGEKAPFQVVDDTVHVNNSHCAVSHSQMKGEDLGKWTNTVEYQGANEKFKGKKLVFNQCCEMCLKQFPEMWEESADEILKYHGLSSQ